MPHLSNDELGQLAALSRAVVGMTADAAEAVIAATPVSDRVRSAARRIAAKADGSGAAVAPPDPPPDHPPPAEAPGGMRITPVRDFRTDGGFDLIEPVDDRSGGTARVFRARGRHTDAEFAVKLIDRDRAFSALTAAAAIVEAELLSRIDHRNVVKVLAGGESDRGPFVAMELVPGANLRNWVVTHSDALTSDPRAAGRFAARLVRAVCDGLTAAAVAGIVHGDVKPANVLVRDGGLSATGPAGPVVRDPTAVKVADFGSAVAARRDGTARPRTSGTPPFMAPEQYTGGPDRRSDVFAVGVLLAYVATGGRFVDELEPAVGQMRALVDALPAVPGPDRKEQVARLFAAADVRGRVTAEVIPDPLLRAICLRCLEADPAERYGSAAEVADELLRWEEDRAPRAVHPSRLLRAGLFLARCRRGGDRFEDDQARLWGVALVALAALVGLFGVATASSIARAGLPVTPVMRLGSAALAAAVLGVCGVLAFWFRRGKTIRQMAGYCLTYTVGFGLVLWVFGRDDLRITQVTYVLMGVFAVTVGLSHPRWQPSRWVGCGMLVTAAPVTDLWAAYPDRLLPYSGLLLSGWYVAFLVGIGWKQLRAP
jgi:hypothetical protein